jgi:hypothetical protein
MVDWLIDGNISLQKYFYILSLSGYCINDRPFHIKFGINKLAYDCCQHIDVPLHNGHQFFGHIALRMCLKGRQIAQLGFDTFNNPLTALCRGKVEVFL